MAKRKVNRNRLIRRAIVGGIKAQTTVDDIRATTAPDQVVASIASYRVIMIRALDNLNTIKGITLGIAAPGTAVGHVDAYPLGRQRVIGNINTVATKERVSTPAADQNIVAIMATQRVIATTAAKLVVLRIAFQIIRMVRADQVLNRIQAVTLGITAACCSSRKRYRDSHLRRGEIRSIAAIATLQHIFTATTAQDIVAGVTDKRVCTTIAIKPVVAIAPLQNIVSLVPRQGIIVVRAGKRLDVVIQVTLSMAALPQTRIQASAHTDIRTREVNNIPADSAVDLIAAVAANNRIIASTGGDGVVA